MDKLNPSAMVILKARIGQKGKAKIHTLSTKVKTKKYIHRTVIKSS